MGVKEEELKEGLEKVFVEFTNSFHYSFLLETRNREFVFEYFKERVLSPSPFPKERGENTNANTNFFINLKLFDIDKARSLIEFGNTNFKEKAFIVISFYSATREAQNALLKFLEDRSDDLKIILIIHYGASLINTIISRLYKLELKDESIISSSGEEEFLKSLAENFLSTKKINRMKIKEITEILARKDEYALEFEDKERTDREIIEKFLLNIYDILFTKYKDFIIENYNKEKDLNKENISAEMHIDKKENKFNMFDYQNKEFNDELNDIFEAIKYIKLNSSSGKTILEYLSLRLPEF